MRDLGADILAIVEAENRPVLIEMNRFILTEVGGTPYPNIMIIDGNDLRGIDVGIMTKGGFPIGTMRSHVHDLKPNGKPVFSRDCPEYQVATPSGKTIWVLPIISKANSAGTMPAVRQNDALNLRPSLQSINACALQAKSSSQYSETSTTLPTACLCNLCCQVS
jgi:hypothetical protein